MPVARGPRFDLRSAAIIGGIALVVAFGIGIAAIVLAQNSGTIEVRLGDQDFRSLKTDRMAAEIAENGPILWPDVAGGSRDIWLQHIGDDPATGWTAFDARRPATPRDCNVVWDAADQHFDDPCEAGLTYPADGTGLEQIPVYLDGTELVIDINRVRSPDEFTGYSTDGSE